MHSKSRKDAVKSADKLRLSVESWKVEKGYSDTHIAKEIGIGPSKFKSFMQGKILFEEDSTIYERCLTMLGKQKWKDRGHQVKAKKLPKPPTESFRKNPTPDEEEFLLNMEHHDEIDEEVAFNSMKPGPEIHEIMSLSCEEGAMGEYCRLLNTDTPNNINK